MNSRKRISSLSCLCLGALLCCLLLPASEASAAESGQNLIRLFEKLNSRPVKFGGMLRSAVRVPLPLRQSMELTLPNQPRLSFSWQVTREPEAPKKIPLMIRVIIETPDGKKDVALERIYDTAWLQSQQRWIHASVDLSAWEGQKVRLSFIAFFQEDTRAKIPGGLRLFLGSPVIFSDTTEARRPPNIILIGYDTLRTDHLSDAGYERQTSPTLDALAKESIVFDQTYSPSCWTLPAFASILTGLYPSQHMAINSNRKLSDQFVTLAEILRENGYYTAGFHDSGYVDDIFGFGQGFDIYEAMKRQTEFLEYTRSLVNLSWLKTHAQMPLFMFIHTYDVHAPYETSPEAYDRMFTDPDYVDKRGLGEHPKVIKMHRFEPLEQPDIDYITGLYDGGIRFADDRLKDLLAELKKLGIFENSLIIFFSDHGEEFNDHGAFGHGDTLYREIAHVPLMIRGPGLAAGRRIQQHTGLINVFSTVLDFAGLDYPGPRESLASQTLMPLLAKGDFSEEQDSFVITQFVAGRAFAVRDKEWTYLRRGGNRKLFHTAKDPFEQIDMAGKRPDLVEAYDKRYRAVVHNPKMKLQQAAQDASRLDARAMEMLKSLGYLQ